MSTSQQHLNHGALLVKMRSITKAPNLCESIWGSPTISCEHGSTRMHKFSALFIEYLTMATAYFHDDIMCRRKRGCVWRRLSSITTAAAAPPSFMIWTKDSTTWWRCQGPWTSLKHPLKIHSQLWKNNMHLIMHQQGCMQLFESIQTTNPVNTILYNKFMSMKLFKHAIIYE